MKKTINVITLGCSKNLVDSEVLMGQLKESYDIVHDSNAESDIVVINTCGFIHDAKEESIDVILRAVEQKKAGLIENVYVTGCLSQRYKDDLSAEIENVDGFYGVNDLREILSSLNVDYKIDLLGERVVTTPKHYAYLKISEGCNRSCSFCAIPLIRGQHKSKPKEEIINEATMLANKGVKELILIAQDLTWYGIDIYKKRELPDLIKQLSHINGIEWIRLHYTYPANFPSGLLKVMRENDKVCSYLDMPLQHINSRILRSMKRGIGGSKTEELINKIKAEVPGIAIRTTLIVGYPGETEEEYKELYEFVKRTKFDRLGVFTYSPEEDTHAYKLNDDVPEEVKQHRLEEIMMLQQEISFNKNSSYVGSTFKVIIDRKENDDFIGRTQFDSPEVDNEVIITKSEIPIEIGNFYKVKIIGSDFFDLTAKIIA